MRLEKHAVFGEIHDGVGGVQQEIEHENEQEYGKKLTHLLTQQLTIHWGEGVEIKYAANKKSEQKYTERPKN